MSFNDIDRSVVFGKNCTIRNFIYIGEGTVIGDNVKIANHCDIGKNCKIGNNVNLQAGVILNDGTVVGDNTFMAGRVTMADEKYPSVGRQVRRPCTIGKNCILGLGCTIVASSVGDGAVIGAHSLVMEDVPAQQVWVGNPARPMLVDGKTRQTLGVRKSLKDTDPMAWNIELMNRADYDKKKGEWEAGVGG